MEPQTGQPTPIPTPVPGANPPIQDNNPLEPQPNPTPTIPQPGPIPPNQPTYNQTIPPTEGANAKIRSAKYIATIFGATAFYFIIALVSNLVFRPLNSISYIVYFVVIAMIIVATSKIKKKGVDVLSEEEKYRMVILMSFDIIIGQAIYYYRLKKTMPQTAKTALKIGWKVLLLQLIPTLIAIIAIVVWLAMSGVQTQAWVEKNKTQYTSDLSKITTDVHSIASSAQANDDNGVQSGCAALQADVESLQKIDSYPVKQTQSQLDNAYSTILSGATDCQTAVTNKNATLLSQSSSEMNNGVTSLATPVQAIFGSTK